MMFMASIQPGLDTNLTGEADVLRKEVIATIRRFTGENLVDIAARVDYVRETHNNLPVVTRWENAKALSRYAAVRNDWM